MRILLLLAFLLPCATWADEALWDLLKAGGQVVLVRHTTTVPGAGDPPGFSLEDCSTQRNLSEEGKKEARRLGEAFAKRKVPVARVLSSPWCRCMETARLAFGRGDVTKALSNLHGRPENRERQVREMKKLLVKEKKGNVVLVSHGSTIVALTDVYLGMGEMVVVTPQGKGRFRVAGRLSLE